MKTPNFDEEPEPLWKPGQVARILGISETTLGKLARAGELPSVRVGKQRRFRRAVVLAYIHDQDDQEAPNAPAA